MTKTIYVLSVDACLAYAKGLLRRSSRGYVGRTFYKKRKLLQEGYAQAGLAEQENK